MQERDLGSLGETEFKRLCISAGLTVHKSEMDKTGWDFLIEFPWKQDNQVPQDMLLAPIECKVQVKSTDKQRKKEYITLSNLNRLVKEQMPAFFCFIEFDGDERAQAVYLVHIGAEIIERTLRRIRELENSSDGDSLNKKKLPISYGTTSRLNSITGKAFRDEIEKYVPEGIEKYINSKNSLLETIGFEEGSYQVTITIAGDNPISDLVDLSLGIRKEINMVHSIGYHKRFGILSRTPNLDREGGIISLKVKPIEVMLKFKKDKFSLGVFFSANLYNSPFNKFISENHSKFRVRAKFFEFIIEPGRSINFSIQTYGEDCSLKDWKDFLKVLTALESSPAPLLVELEFDAISSYLMSLSPKDLPPSLFEIIIANQIYNWDKINQIVEMAIKICQKLNVLESNVLVRIEELISFSRGGDGLLLYQALNGDAESVVLLFPNEVEGYLQGAKAAAIFFIKACIGNYIIGCCLGIVGTLSFLGERQSLMGERFLIGQQFIDTDEAAITKELVDIGLNELAEGLQDEELVIIAISL